MANFSNKVLKTLWGRAGGRCSFPLCQKELFHDEDDAPSPTLIGENCHIVAENAGGPRGKPTIDQAEINLYPNLILMCRNHHKIIDDNINGAANYSVEVLHEYKENHEKWVRDKLGVDSVKLKDDEYYAGIIDGWMDRFHIADWSDWTSWLLSSGRPGVNRDIWRDIQVGREWMVKRIWPKRYLDLENSFENFRRVIITLQQQFDKHSVKYGEDEYLTKKIYDIDEWNEERYSKLLSEYEYHVDLVQDLTVEATRSVNWVCDEIRSSISPSFMRDSGRISFISGPNQDLSFKLVVPEYSEIELEGGEPFKGLESFKADRSKRDFCFYDV